MWLLVTVIAGCCTAPVPTASAPATTQTLAEQLEETTVALTHTDSDGDHAPYCSGVWVSQDEILTANHCVEAYGKLVSELTDFEGSFDATGITLQYVVRDDVSSVSPGTYPKNVRRGLVVKTDNINDLALIKAKDLPAGDHPVASIKRVSRVPDGTHLRIVGHTLGLWWTYCEGTVSSSWSLVEGPDSIKTQVIQASSAAAQGNSGGGAFDDDGNLLGVLSWVLSTNPNISFFIHHDQLVKFLARLLAEHLEITVGHVIERGLSVLSKNLPRSIRVL